MTFFPRHRSVMGFHLATAVVLVMATAASPSHAQSIVYVNAVAPPGGDGTSWETAYADLQDGLDRARSDPEAREFWVARGEYRADRNTGNFDLSFELVDGLALYGGFAGHETERDQRDHIANPTILTGELDDPLEWGDNTRCILYADEDVHDLTIDGFEITRAFGRDSWDSASAIHFEGYEGTQRLVLTNCRITQNAGNGAFPVRLNFIEEVTVSFCEFTQNGALDTDSESGGGIYAYCSTITIQDCAFAGNGMPWSSWGTAIIVEEGTATIQRCRMANNYGHGIQASQASLIIEDCEFVENEAAYGSGISIDGLLEEAHPILIRNCSFVRNTTYGNIGGASGLRARDTSIRVEVCDFSDNSSSASHGASYLIDASGEFVDCTFSSNTATYGGAVGLYTSTALFQGCLFEGNRGGEVYGGGGVRVSESECSLIECEFVGNTSISGGGAVQVTTESTAEISSCFLAGNSSEQGGGAISIGSSDLVVTDSVFIGNGAPSGGAISGSFTNEYGNPIFRLEQCAFIENQATESGGAVELHSGRDHPAMPLQFVNTLFAGNTAQDGGALHTTWLPLNFINNTFVSNHARSEGGALALAGESDVTLVNTIVHDNDAAGSFEEIAQIFRTGTDQLEINYSCIQNWTGIIDGFGNFDADPMFVDPENGDYRLAIESPCVDAGDNVSIPPFYDGDLDGQPRYAGAFVDLGPYENQEAPATLTARSPNPGLAGMTNSFDAGGASPDENVYYIYGFNDGQTPIPGCPGLNVDIGSPKLAGYERADEHGFTRLRSLIPDRAAGRRIYLQVLDRSTCRVSERIEFAAE